jgi:hypothetical protein
VAGARQSKASHRREREARESVTHERVTLIAAGVLVAVAILVGAGVVWGLILPPRAHIVTVGDKSFNASDMVKYATFLVAGNSTSQDDPITTAINLVKHDETLLQAGAADAGTISDDDITKAIRKRIGVPEDATAEAYADQYKSFLSETAIDKPTFERMVRAQVIGERVGAKFLPEIGEAGQQFHVMGVGSRDRAKIQALRDAVSAGGDFVAKATELGIVPAGQTPDFGWILPPYTGFLKDVGVEKLQAGQMTEISERNFQFELYRMAERDEKRTYTEEQKKTLANRKVDAWILQQADKVKVTEDVSDGERKWILKRVTANAQKIAEARQKAAPKATVTFPGKK